MVVKLLGLAVLGSVLSTSLSVWTRVALPDWSLLVGVYATLTSRNDTAQGPSGLRMWILGAALGYLTDLLEGTPQGLRALSLGFLLLLLHRVAGKLLFGGRMMQALLAALSLLVFRLFEALLIAVFSQDPHALLRGLSQLPEQLLLTALLAPATVSVLSRLLARTGPPRRGL